MGNAGLGYSSRRSPGGRLRRTARSKGAWRLSHRRSAAWLSSVRRVGVAAGAFDRRFLSAALPNPPPRSSSPTPLLRACSAKVTCFFPSPCGVLDLSVALISSKASQMTTALSNATSSGVPNDGATAFGSSAPLSILLVERQQRPLSAQYASRGRWIHSAGWAVGPLAELLLPPPLTVSPPPPLLPPLLPGDLTLPDHENQLDGRSGDERSDGLFKRTGGGFGGT